MIDATPAKQPAAMQPQSFATWNPTLGIWEKIQHNRYMLRAAARPMVPGGSRRQGAPRGDESRSALPASSQEETTALYLRGGRGCGGVS